MKPEPNFRVPALEKGLDVIEALADEPKGLLQKELAERVGRSASEIFRVLGAMEARGYIARDQAGAYTLTLRLFELAHMHPPTRKMTEIALARMETLVESIACSAHLVTPHRDQLMVVAQVQPDILLMGWSVKVGGIFPMAWHFASARILGAFQREDKWETTIERLVDGDPETDRKAAIEKARVIRQNGQEVSSSAIAPGVTDISCPILNHLGVAVAALTVPYVGNLAEQKLSVESIAAQVKKTAAEISQAIGGKVSK